VCLALVGVAVAVAVVQEWVQARVEVAEVQGWVQALE
jgi:hypothetical protein